MTLRHLPKLENDTVRGVQYEPPASVIARWNPAVVASKSDNNTIEIYDQIGEDGFGGGFSLKRLSAALRSIGENDVVVSINSPGGNFFDGIAAYNMLREHKAKVTVRVVGLAASAASVIAMAADELEIAETAFLMIHNSWVLAMGNRNDLMEVADTLGRFDDSMATLYASRAGQDVKKVKKMMNDETWMSGKEAVEMGFADALLPSDNVKEDEEQPQSALRRIDVALAKDGVTRSQRRAIIKEVTGTPSAAEPVTPSADDQSVILKELLESLKSLKG